MYNGLDIFATLHRVVRQAMAGLADTQRGSLIVRDGQRLVYRAVVGYNTAVPDAPKVGAEAGRLSPSPPFGPEAAPQAAQAMCVVPAAAWYRAHHPGAAALRRPQASNVGGNVGGNAGADGRSDVGGFMLVVPFHMHGEPSGYLALEQATTALPEGERRALLEMLTEITSSALERYGLYYASARAAQEMCLLKEVLDVAGSSVDLGMLLDTVGNGIRNVQSGLQWSSVDLALLDLRQHSGGAPGPEFQVRFFKVPNQPITAFWNNVRDGATSAGRDLQISVEFTVGTAGGPTSQREVLEAGIRQGVQGIALAPLDPAHLEPTIRRASDAGIPLLTIDTPAVEGSRALLYVGTDNEAAGRLAGEMMARLLPDGGIVATQLSSRLAVNSAQRIAAFTSAVAGTAISVDPPTENLFDAALGLELAVAALEEQPAIAGAFGACSDNGPSWGQASRALGRAGELKIVAFDLVTATGAMLREGLIQAAVVQREYDIGYRAVQILYDMITRSVEEVLAELPASRIIDTGVDVVTLERTPWSTALSDYLNLSAARKLASRRASHARDRAIKVLVVGMAERDARPVEKSARFTQASLIGHVMSSSRSLIIDTAAPEYDGWEDVVAARHEGVRTLVGVPLPARSGTLGVLVLSSGREGACSPEDLALLERMGTTTAVAVENAQMLQHTLERSRDLERANVEQEALLRTIAEMSSPVVPIARGVLVMPLVGTLDTRRSSRFMEALLHEISDHQARVVLIDVTGMAVVDAAAAQHLVQAAQAAKLLGAEVVLVGISPAAAQLMVEQSLDLGGVVTRSTLELGFAYALRKTKGRIVYKS